LARIACFGEVLLRLAPQDGVSLRRASGLDVHVGGAEANVAVGLAQLGHEARLITTLPAGQLGELARRRLSEEGLDLAFLREGEGRMGTYFHNPGAGPRGGDVIYDRAGSAFAFADAGAYDFASALDGVDHLHISGISPAVSKEAAAATSALVEQALTKRCTISFDGNYRASLWQASGRDPRAVLTPLVAQADMVIGNYRDAGLLLGRDFGDTGPRSAAEAMFAAFPKLAMMVSTARSTDADETQTVTARIDRREGLVEAGPIALAGRVGRIGTGDAFAAGVLHRWLESAGDKAALWAGLRAMAVKTAQPGDLPDLMPSDLDGNRSDIAR
jgi:2-dehydro-3-deoxygluconokinase